MCGWTRLLVILTAIAVGAASGSDQKSFQQHAAPSLMPAQRAFDNTNSTGNLIFWSINSLLQVWPNGRYTAGHTIAAANVPPGTILYHGRTDNNQPTKLEWLATDPEFSYVFCQGRCYIYTYVTTRPLRLVYFDGSSAAKMYSGTMDTQDIVLWGKVRPNMTWSEPARIQELCKWGEQFELDGFVRMALDFEIMVCDFDAGLKLVSGSEIISHTHNPLFPKPRLLAPEIPLPPGWRGSPRSGISNSFESANSGMWHSRSPGETRVKIDYSRIVSFFDPALSSIVEARTGKPREYFRLDGISEADSRYIRDQLTDVFSRSGQGSRIDWGSITQVIVDRYGGRLELLRHILQNPESKRNVTERVAEARSQVLIMLTPYMLTSAIPPNPIGPIDRSWIDPVVKHCASTHTAWAPEALLTRQEKVIKEAVEEVLSRICSILGDIWVDAFYSEEAGVEELERFLEKWQLDIIELMDWLDWSMWLRCDPACGPEEICYIPTWPWGYLSDEGEKDTVDMSPRCVEAVAPYSFLHPSVPGHQFS